MNPLNKDLFMERDSAHEQGEGQESRRSRLPTGRGPTRGAIPELQDHDLGRNRDSDPRPTAPPRHPKLSTLHRCNSLKCEEAHGVVAAVDADPRSSGSFRLCHPAPGSRGHSVGPTDKDRSPVRLESGQTLWRPVGRTPSGTGVGALSPPHPPALGWPLSLPWAAPHGS